MKLAGIKVVDLTQFLPGPFLTMTMADHGAEVVKIEPPGGDPTRGIGPRQSGHTVYFRNVNRGKKSVVVDLKQAVQRDAVLDLMVGSDVVIESFRPGVAARLGLDYASVAVRAPHIVYCSISAFGQTGPLTQRAAHDLSIEAMTGALSLTQTSDQPPKLPAVPAADMSASLMALSGILMALLRVRQTGLGDHLDIAMHDSLMAWLLHGTGPVFAEGRDIDPAADRALGGAAFYNLYQTADDRWISLGGSEIKFAQTLLVALGRPDLLESCKAPPGAPQQPVKDYLTRTFRSRPLDHWLSWLEGKDVCYAPVNTLSEAFQSAQTAAREMRLTDREGADHIGAPIKFAREPAQLRFNVPALGADDALLGALVDAGANRT
ncbi:CoA transferase [Bradyrhizobium sp. 14AA]